SYASMNWIRFEGSPCRAVTAPLASQPLAGAPLVSAGPNIVHGCAGVKARTHLGRKHVGKKCNREGNLCKTRRAKTLPPGRGPAARWPPAVLSSLEGTR